MHGLDVAEDMDVWRIRPSGGPRERLTRLGASVTSIALLDPRTLIYVSPAADRSGPWLWALDIDAKTSHRVSAGLEQYRSVSATSDGHRVVATVANPTANLWSVPILDRVAGDADIEAFTVPTVRALGPRFRGTSMFYLSARGTGDGLWRLQDGQTTEVWKGSDGALRESAAVSPDGSRVVIMVRKAGKGQLMLVTADGSESRTLTGAIDAQGAADWAPDGSAIVTGGSDEQGLGLFRIPIMVGRPCGWPRAWPSTLSGRQTGLSSSTRRQASAVASRSRPCDPTGRRSSCRRYRSRPATKGTGFCRKERASCIDRPGWVVRGRGSQSTSGCRISTARRRRTWHT